MDSALAPVITSAGLARLPRVRPEMVLLDVRPRREFEAEHIDESPNIPFDERDAASAELQSADVERIMLVCRSGQRAHSAYATLTGAGRTGLSVLDGGVLDWVATGHSLVRAG